MSKVMTIDEAIAFPFEDLLREVNETQEFVRVVMEEGKAVEITSVTPRLKPLTQLPGRVADGWKDELYVPKPRLKPLITFEGYVPDGWKEVIYEPKR